MSVSKKQYDRARRLLVGYPKEEKAMRVVERGAIEFGQAEMRKWWVRELRAKGWRELATYFGRLAPR